MKIVLDKNQRVLQRLFLVVTKRTEKEDVSLDIVF